MNVLRTPSTSASKQDTRSDEMRRVHASYIGYICPIQSADTGEQVGMVKEKSIISSITESTSSELLKEFLLEDKDIISLERVFPNKIHEFNLTKILVNGDWIGCCLNSPVIVSKYKEIRRGYQCLKSGFEDKSYKHIESAGISNKSTICWDTNGNEINFLVDAGRIVRPLLVVRNNGELDPIGRETFGTKYDPFKNTGFLQDILLSKADVDLIMQKGLTIDVLHERGIIDYISPAEMENCYIASSFDILKENQENPLQQYTHCEIPAGIFGIPALTCPYAAHNQPPRITFQTNQVKQTCGWYSLNWPDRIDKHAFLQYYCEAPLIKTLANKYIYPNGRNTITSIASFTGYNQEDSVVFNDSSSDRGNFSGEMSNYIKTELEKDEKFENPDESNTIIEKKFANFSKIKNGLPEKGTILRKDDVVIAKRVDVPKPQDNKIYKDTSILYTNDEEAIVDMAFKARNQDDQEFAKVKFSSVRRLDIGNKFSSRHGQKALTGLGLLQWNLPFTSEGLVPNLILNPHAIPSRMTIGQLIEGVASKVCALNGSFGDGTIFKKVDLRAIGDELERHGYDRYGTEPCFDGRTGEPIDKELFITPIYYQRLQKFVVDEMYSISTGPTCLITRQPLEGRSHKGGLRVGEMEVQVALASSSCHFLLEKFREDSDGFEMYICRTCGKRPVVNENEGIANCPTCSANKMDSDIVKVKSAWSSGLFLNELMSTHVGVKLQVSPYSYNA